MNNWNLKAKKAVTTGGTKGIGKAIVQEFLKLGAKVLFTGRNSEKTVNLQKEWQDAEWEVYALSGDVSDRNQDSWDGKLDILVNNAGINLRKTSIAYAIDDYQQVLNRILSRAFSFQDG